MKIIFYSKANDRVPVKEFINKLALKDRTKILACLQNIEDLGFQSPRVAFRQLKGDLWEIKIRVQSKGYRIFYVCLKQNTMVLLHSYRKQSQKAPKKELEMAEKRMIEVLKDEKSYIT